MYYCVFGCVLTCLCVSPVNAGSFTGSERTGGTRLSDPGAQPTRAAEQGRSRRPTVWLHRPHDELHPAGKTQECRLSVLCCIKEVENRMFWFSLWLLLIVISSYLHKKCYSNVLVPLYKIRLLFLFSGLLTYGWTWYCCCPAAIGHRLLSGE